MHSGQLLSIQTGTIRPLRVGERKLMSAIGKTPVPGAVAVGPLGLAGDEQSDLSVHGGLRKAVYALPSEHLSWWQQQRQARGVTLFEETLAPGYLGENLSLQSVLEQEVFIGDVLRFEDVTLRVTQPREPCGKFNAVMGYAQAAKDYASRLPPAKRANPGPAEIEGLKKVAEDAREKARVLGGIQNLHKPSRPANTTPPR